jgi:hypothetical protein
MMRSKPMSFAFCRHERILHSTQVRPSVNQHTEDLVLSLDGAPEVDHAVGDFRVGFVASRPKNRKPGAP